MAGNRFAEGKATKLSSAWAGRYEEVLKVPIIPTVVVILGFELATVNLDGTDTRRLTVSRDYENFPSWSPDGNKIAYLTRARNSGNSNTERPEGRIVVGLLTLSGKVEETRSYGDHAASVEPAWSPDGRFLAFG